MCVPCGVGAFEVKHERDELEVNGRVRIDEAEGNRLLHACKDGFVVFVAKPLKAREDRRGILACSEGGVVVKEAFRGFKLQEFILVVHDREMKRVARLVAAVPEVGHSTHVRVS